MYRSVVSTIPSTNSALLGERRILERLLVAGMDDKRESLPVCETDSEVLHAGCYLLCSIYELPMEHIHDITVTS